MTKTQMVMETTTIGDTMMSILLLVGSMQKGTLGHWSYTNVQTRWVISFAKKELSGFPQQMLKNN